MTTMPDTPCFMRVIPFRGDHDDRPRYVESAGRRKIYPTFGDARACASDASVLLDTLSSCDYRIELLSVDGRTFRRLPDRVVDELWELAEDYRYHNCVGARLGRGESVAV